MKNYVMLVLSLFLLNCTPQKSVNEQPQETVTTMEIPNQSSSTSSSSSSSSSLVQPKDPLIGKWQLDYISPTSGKDISHFKIQKPYLTFVDNLKVAGNNGCNNIFGEYEADERTISFKTDKFGATRMFCENLDEKAFLNALKSVNRYAVMDDGVKLIMSTDDVVTLSFTKVFEKELK